MIESDRAWLAHLLNDATNRLIGLGTAEHPEEISDALTLLY